jgi:hypothetical protein
VLRRLIRWPALGAIAMQRRIPTGFQPESQAGEFQLFGRESLHREQPGFFIEFNEQERT